MPETCLLHRSIHEQPHRAEFASYMIEAERTDDIFLHPFGAAPLTSFWIGRCQNWNYVSHSIDIQFSTDPAGGLIVTPAVVTWMTGYDSW